MLFNRYLIFSSEFKFSNKIRLIKAIFLILCSVFTLDACLFNAKKFTFLVNTLEKISKQIILKAKTTSVFWIIFFLLNFHHSNQQTAKTL